MRGAQNFKWPVSRRKIKRTFDLMYRLLMCQSDSQCNVVNNLNLAVITTIKTLENESRFKRNVAHMMCTPYIRGATKIEKY